MATSRKISKKRRTRRLILVLSILLAIVAAVCVYFFLYLPIRAERIAAEEAAAAGAQFDSADIPRSPYLHEGFTMQGERVMYEDEKFETLTGIDVSSHQGEIDWNAVAQDEISYAVIQAGYRGYEDGALNEDIMFRTNLVGAQAAGLPCGVYFFSQAISEDEAREEAEFLLDLLDGVTLELPVFYDWEPVSAEHGRANALGGETVTACAKAFCETVAASGFEAAIYFNQNQIYTQVRLEQLLDYPLWMAQYQNEPDCIYAYTWWQYTDNGTVAGITTPVDLNLWFRPINAS